MSASATRKSAAAVGNTSLTHFDTLIIGSGAGGGSAAEMLTRHGQKVLILEAGPNYFENLDDPDFSKVRTQFSSDELKLARRNFVVPDSAVDPRTFRSKESKTREFIGDVNHLPKTVGGGTTHADMKTPRFHPQDFQMASLMGDVAGATFADWPVCYEELEPFYAHMERILGVQGMMNASPFDAPRKDPYPMAPGNPMYVALLGKKGADKLGLHAFPYPSAINSQTYDGRPACNDCGFCSGYGCPTGAKASSAVTGIRKALLSGNALLLPETKVTKLMRAGRAIAGVEAITADGERVVYRADRYILAASAIEDARLLLASDPGGAGVGNSSGLVGRNLTFHFQTFGIGIFEQRLHTHRGRAVTHGFLDYRGWAGDNSRPMGGIVEIGGEEGLIDEATNYASQVGLSGYFLKKFLRESPLRDRLMALIMHGEDAPQYTNRVDLDPQVQDYDGIPAARITYRSHKFELTARKYYSEKMLDLFGAAGAKFGFIAPADTIAKTGHIMGTLRFGHDPKASVCDKSGRFHDLDNLYAADGSLFPTASGLNPTLTIMALSSYVAASMLSPSSPALALAR